MSIILVAPMVMVVMATTHPCSLVFSPNVMEIKEMARPLTLVPAPHVMAVPARTEPSKSVLFPAVKVAPSTHIMFSGLAPLVRMIVQFEPTSMVVTAWKRNLDSKSFPPSKVTLWPASILMDSER